MVCSSAAAAASRSVQRAYGYLEKLARQGSTGAFSAQASLDIGFRSLIPRSAIRSRIRDISGTDPGFDIGADAFAAMIGLAVSSEPDPVFPRELLGRFSETVTALERRSRYTYFVDTPEFAADTDCTALAAGALYEHGRLSHAELGATARELLRARAPHTPPPQAGGHNPGSGIAPGVVMVYWDDTDHGARPRGRKQDPVVCANALYTLSLAAASGAGGVSADSLNATARYVGAHLNTSAYRAGTRYYPDPHAFLFAVSRLCGRFPHHAQAFGSDLSRRIAQQPNDPEHPLALAHSIITADTMGVPSARLEERKRLLVRSQQDDGSWPAAPYYRMGRFAVYFGSPLVTTLFAVRALGASA